MSLNLSIHNITQVVGKCKITNYTASFYALKLSEVVSILYVILRLSLILVLFECSRVRVACFALAVCCIMWLGLEVFSFQCALPSCRTCDVRFNLLQVKEQNYEEISGRDGRHNGISFNGLRQRRICGAPCRAGVGTLGVAFAFGLSVVAMAYTIGGISGCHINPAITLGVFLSKRMSGKDAAMYMVFQVIGAILGSLILYILVSTGSHGGPTATGSNGFADGMMLQAFIAELVFTFIFVLVVLGTTDSSKGAGSFAGLAIGLALVLVHIVCIPITGTSVNPARSIGPALFEGGKALSQLWLFIVAPFAGAALSALVWKVVGK